MHQFENFFLQELINSAHSNIYDFIDVDVSGKFSDIR